MPTVKLFIVSGILIAFLGLGAWFVYRETRVPQNEAEVQNRVFELQKEGRYDKAVQVLQEWVTDSRRDPSQDDLLLQQIALTYFMKAYKKPATRDESIQKSALNLEKALELFEKKPEGLSLDLYEIGRNYEELGKLSAKNQCQYYEKARECYTRQLPLIKGESFTAYSHTTRLEPVRAEVTKHLNAIELTISQARCQAPQEKQPR